MTNPRLTPAQRRFIEEFDIYTRRGTEPREYRSLRDLWRVQHRTMNWCQRMGLLARRGISRTGDPIFVVNPEKRDELGLRKPVFKTKLLRPRKRLSRI
jgi:hypothetical protein